MDCIKFHILIDECVLCMDELRMYMYISLRSHRANSIVLHHLFHPRAHDQPFCCFELTPANSTTPGHGSVSEKQDEKTKIPTYPRERTAIYRNAKSKIPSKTGPPNAAAAAAASSQEECPCALLPTYSKHSSTA